MNTVYTPMMMRLAPTILLLAACATDAPEESATTQSVGCGKFLCGSNSPHAGALEFYELALDGTPAPENQLSITSFKDKFGVPMTIDVAGFRLRGIKPGNVIVGGQGLVGAKLVIGSTLVAVDYEVTIDSVVSTQKYYELGDDMITTLPSYGMTIRDLTNGGRPQRLCPLPHNDSQTYQAGPYDALIYRGDRYDRTTGEVYATGAASGRWFNIACAGDSLSKILITRHAEAASDALHVTTANQRTAMVRMFRADYCGDAIPHTVLGTPLDWANAGGWNFILAPLTSTNIEAIWNHAGAVCLSHPRLPPGPLWCTPPPCTAAQIANWKLHGDLVSALP